MAQSHGCVTADEILSQFGKRKGPAQGKYREFIRDGIGRGSLWDDLKGQNLLGVEGFVEGLLPLVREKKAVREIPKGQRYVGRPLLDELFRAQD